MGGTRELTGEAPLAAVSVLLLHGLGATGAVWYPVADRLAARGPARVLAPDLPGHGTGPRHATYTVEGAAAYVAAQLAGDAALYVVGHSFGGYVALALAAGGYGVQPRGVLTVGTKLSFDADEQARAADLARRPARIFETREEAVARYRKVSGLDARLAPGERLLERGVVADGSGYRLAADPATVGVVVPPFAALLAGARCPTLIARGEGDPIVTSAELRAVAPEAIDVRGCGHNLQVESPAALIGLLERLWRG